MKRLVFFVLCLSYAGVALAQDDGVGKSGMEQGEASINVRSDVKLGVKGTAGTTSERLTKLGEAAVAQMSDIRACYRKQVSKSPDIVGNLRVEVSLPEKGPAKVAAGEQQGASDELSKCVTRVFEKTSWKEVGRPAAAILSLEFDNTRARGQALMNERAAETSRVEVRVASDGRQEATWSTEGNQVTFTVRADASAPRASVENVVHGFHDGYAGFLDCRRHCEKGEVSPEGDIHAEVMIDRAGKANIKLGAITVANERAPKCAERAFKRVEFEKSGSPIRADVLVHFAK